MKGGFLGRLGNGILWALSENLQIKRAGLMESNGGGGGEVVGVLGNGDVSTRCVPKDTHDKYV